MHFFGSFLKNAILRVDSLSALTPEECLLQRIFCHYPMVFPLLFPLSCLVFEFVNRLSGGPSMDFHLARKLTMVSVMFSVEGDKPHHWSSSPAADIASPCVWSQLGSLITFPHGSSFLGREGQILMMCPFSPVRVLRSFNLTGDPPHLLSISDKVIVVVLGYEKLCYELRSTLTGFVDPSFLRYLTFFSGWIYGEHSCEALYRISLFRSALS